MQGRIMIFDLLNGEIIYNGFCAHDARQRFDEYDNIVEGIWQPNIAFAGGDITYAELISLEIYEMKEEVCDE